MSAVEEPGISVPPDKRNFRQAWNSSFYDRRAPYGRTSCCGGEEKEKRSRKAPSDRLIATVAAAICALRPEITNPGPPRRGFAGILALNFALFAPNRFGIYACGKSSWRNLRGLEYSGRNGPAQILRGKRESPVRARQLPRPGGFAQPSTSRTAARAISRGHGSIGKRRRCAGMNASKAFLAPRVIWVSSILVKKFILYPVGVVRIALRGAGAGRMCGRCGRPEGHAGVRTRIKDERRRSSPDSREK